MIATTFREETFRDKSVLVAGGTSGIGAVIGDAFSALGASVTVTGATEGEAPGARERAGSRVERAAVLDVRDGAAVAAFVSALAKLDVLVPGYSASKGGVAQLTKSLAGAYAADGIRVNAIAPGWIATALTQPLQDDPMRSQMILSRTPLGRWGKPEDVAGTAVFLCSPAASFITGTMVPIDGGYLAA